MKKTLKVIWGILGTIFILLAVFVLFFLYQMNWKRTRIAAFENSATHYSVVLQEIGSPFLFGASEVRVILKDNRGTAVDDVHTFISNDGGNLSPYNISVSWVPDGAIVTLRGQEQYDEVIVLGDADIEKEERFVYKALQDFYEKKDLGIKNDLTEYFREDVYPFLEAQIEMEQCLQEKLEYHYTDYELEFIPVECHTHENGGEMSVQIIRRWSYDEESSLSADAEEMYINFGSKEEKLQILECFREQESIQYGPIDRLYKGWLENHNHDERDVLLQEYVTVFKNRYEDE